MQVEEVKRQMGYYLLGPIFALFVSFLSSLVIDDISSLLFGFFNELPQYIVVRALIQIFFTLMILLPPTLTMGLTYIIFHPSTSAVDTLVNVFILLGVMSLISYFFLQLSIFDLYHVNLPKWVCMVEVCK